MKSYVWYVCLCAILTFLTSPALFANFYAVEDGGGWTSGDASGGGWGSSCSSTANAGGVYLSSAANHWASIDFYTDEAGYFFVNWNLGGNGQAYYYDWDGSGASGTGAGGGIGYGESSIDGLTLSSPGPNTQGSGVTYNPGIRGGTLEAEWFDAFSGFGAYSTSVAVASVGSPGNSASASGNGYASVWLSN
ncbi:MAG TPA: hypothetical protein VLI39_21490 [Sedimentisphaerales bacterium]|nr:hypothetical protein [Sedimentisphaerales bacterium]